MPAYIAAGTLAMQQYNANATKAYTTILTNPGDSSSLASVLRDMQGQNTLDAYTKQANSIFQTGYETANPAAINNVNTAGVRQNTSTTAGLLDNQLMAQLTGQATTAIQKRQSDWATAADNYATATKTQTTAATPASSGGGGLFGKLTGADGGNWGNPFQKSSGGGSYICTAIYSKPDTKLTLKELQLLTLWKAKIKSSSIEGEKLVEVYEAGTPEILARLQNPKEVLATCYSDFLIFILEAIRNEQHDIAVTYYTAMWLWVLKQDMKEGE